MAQLNVEYQSQVDYNVGVNDVWGYVAPNGNEYALVGLNNGISIVDVTDPENAVEVDFVPGDNCLWRDIKTWNNYAYVTNDCSGGIAVIDLTTPDDVDYSYWTPDIPNMGELDNCHNIYIDEYGYAYLVGCNLNNGGMLYIDVFTNEGQPEFIEAGPATYSHDVWVNDNKAFCSEMFNGEFSIYEVSDKSNTQLLGDQVTQAEFTHNAWGTPDNNLLFTTDEVANATVGSYDVSDPSNIIELDQFFPFETFGEGVIPHNVHVWQDWIIISYYTDGCIIVDISNPTNLIEVGNFDTFIPTSTGFDGVWGAYPWLPSGSILASDMGNGLYVLAPEYVNACWLEGNVYDAVTTLPISGASIDILNTNVFDESDITGDYATGYAISGTYELLVQKPGYEAATVEAVLVNGVITELDVPLNPLVSFSATGSVLDEETMEPIAGAFVRIANDDFNYDIQADANGQFQISQFWSGTYDAAAGHWGWITECQSASINENEPSLDFILSKGIYDDFSFDFGWIDEDNAESGSWERDVPDGTTYQGSDSNPGDDVGNDCLNLAYVTGNDGGQAGEDDVDDGTVTLTSPVFSGMDTPVLTYWRWFANYDSTTANDEFTISISDGTTEAVLETIDANDPLSIWEEKTFNLWDFLSPSEEYTLILETGDDFDNGSIVEAGFDHFQVEYTIPIDIDEVSTRVLDFYPNPTSGEININVPANMSTTAVQIWNTQGQLVDTFNLEAGTVQISPDLAAGSYVLSWINTNGITIDKQQVAIVK